MDHTQEYLCEYWRLFQQDLKYFAAYKVFVVSKRIKMKRRKTAIDRLDLPGPVARALRKSGGFDKLVSRLPKRQELASVTKEHVVLSDITRMRILHALSRSRLCPCLLKRVTRVADSKLSYHLKILEKAGLIEARRTKSWRIYSITPKGRRALSP